MLEKFKQMSRHLIYILGSNIIYGFIVYYVFMWLSDYSLLYAYLGNIVLIISGLAIDNYSQNVLQSSEFAMQLKKEKNKDKYYRMFQLLIDSFISFKTILYLFYVFILIVSQIVKFYPDLVSENIRNFIGANDYSILFLISLDSLAGQFINDKKRMKEASEKFKPVFNEPDN